MLGKIGRFLKGVVSPAKTKQTAPPPAAKDPATAQAPQRGGIAASQQDVVVKGPSTRMDPQPVPKEMQGPPEPVIPGSAPRSDGVRGPGEIAQAPAPPVPDLPPDPEPPADVRSPRGHSGKIDPGRIDRGRAGHDEGNDPPEECMPTGREAARTAQHPNMPQRTPRPGGVRPPQPPRPGEAGRVAHPPEPPPPPSPDDAAIRSRTAQAQTPPVGPDGPGTPTGPTDPRTAQAPAAMPPAGEPEDEAPQIRQSTQGPAPRPAPPRPEQQG